MSMDICPISITGMGMRMSEDKHEMWNMNANDIEQKLTLLPEGLEEKNIRSCENVLQFYKRGASIPGNEWLMPMDDLIQHILNSDQQKLFRAGLQLYTLIVSTKEEHGLEKGDHHIRVDVNDKNSAEVWYRTNSDELESITSCDSHEIIPILQPFLDRLWNETRGKNNA